MSEWKTVRLGDVCEKGASNITQNEIVDNFGEYPIYGAAGFIKNVDFYKQEEAYIGIVKDGAGVGRISIHPAKSSLIGTMQYIFPNENIDIKFLASFLKYQNLGRFYTGATIPHIYFKDYKNIKLKLPPLETQKQIAAVLDKCTSLISKYKKILEKYDTLIKSRFIEMFSSQKDSFPFCTLDTVSSRIFAGGDRPKETSETKNDEFQYPVFANAETNKGLLCYSKTYQVELPCVTIAARGCTVGYTEVRNEKFTPVVRLLTIIPSKEIIPLFLKYYLDLEMKIEGNGAAQPQLTVPTVKKYQIYVPPLSLQNDFDSFVQKIDKSKIAVQKSLEKAETLYKSLMQEYFG